MADISDKFKKCFNGEVTPEILIVAKKELGETPERRERCLQELKKLIEREKDFHPCMEDAYLLRYLRAKKFNVERAFKNLKNYYTYKARHSGTITDFKPSDIKAILEQNAAYVLAYRDREDLCVTIVRLGKFNLNGITLDMLITTFITCFEIGLEPALTQILGYVLVFDFADFTLSKMMQFASPSFMYKFVVAFQDVMPCRPQAFHFINEPSYISMLTRVLRILMTEKLYKRIHFHGNDLKSLHGMVPPEILPEEYGGMQGPMEHRAKEYVNRILDGEELVAKRNEFGFTGQTLQKLKKR